MQPKQTLLFIIISILAVLACCACSDSPPKGQGQDPVVLTVNDFSMTKSEFLTECAVDMEYQEQYKTSRAAQESMIEGIIRKELLIQEARKMGLDRDAAFMAAIERYWEATLIKQLMEKKNREVHKTTLVSEEEIQAAYERYRESQPDLPPLETIEKEIADGILEEKKAKILEDWVRSLRRKADITIDDQILTK